MPRMQLRADPVNKRPVGTTSAILTKALTCFFFFIVINNM